ncbi:MAG TPA: PA2779 family protein [Terriglobia bacterium]|nr:PA2779 family protein [Terriglobia bacterium]
MLRKPTTVALPLLALSLTMIFAFPAFSAQDHVVSRSDLHHAMVKSASARANNLAQVERFFRAVPVEKSLKGTGISLQQVQQAIPSLSDQELAQLARRTTKLQNDFAAGALTNQQLTYIVIAIATALVVILIFEA